MIKQALPKDHQIERKDSLSQIKAQMRWRVKNYKHKSAFFHLVLVDFPQLNFGHCTKLFGIHDVIDAHLSECLLGRPS